ncbi:hypothetical protein HPB47_003494 [Ixodes persulcatus]|uniref:Uncharacterized protein n=1 Tax=Ixodes persulcatus TaxID=34615 RepID=A0AC60PI91_IXOPE|nr:hypothetical protein HPB47_003494 [Ixodes persulcatus]
MADLADRYLEAQGTQSLGMKMEEKKPTPEPPRPVDKKSTGQRPPLRCFPCNRLGHRAADCRHKVTTKASCWRCKRAMRPTPVKKDQKGVLKLPAVWLPSTPRRKKWSSRTDTWNSGTVTVSLWVGTRSVTVLRDTGCNTVVVWKNLISEEELTGTSKAVYLADGTVKMLPEERLLVRSPFFSGEQTVAGIATLVAALTTRLPPLATKEVELENSERSATPDPEPLGPAEEPPSWLGRLTEGRPREGDPAVLVFLQEHWCSEGHSERCRAALTNFP